MIAIIFVFISLLVGDTGRTHGGNCRPRDSWSDNSVTYFTNIVAGVSPGAIETRHAFKLPFVPAAPAVTLVTDEGECRRAAAALDAFYNNGSSHGPVYLFKIGDNRLAIADGTLQLHIFDSEYRYLMSLRELD